MCPEFVLTDGWYKIRAKTDQALARAARKGKIRVGRKLGVIGARVGRSWDYVSDIDPHLLIAARHREQRP